MGLISWYRSEPIHRLLTAILVVSGLAIVNLIWGGFILAVPQRWHLAGLTSVITAAAIGSILVSRRRPVFRIVAYGLSLVLFLGLGLGLGGYDHLLKLVMTGHGLSTVFGPLGDPAYEIMGILLLPLGLASLATLKSLTNKEDAE